MRARVILKVSSVLLRALQDDGGAVYVEYVLIMAGLTIPMITGLYAVSDVCAAKLTTFPDSIATWISKNQ
jgi:Flp pilus assembly pilin Flp